MPLSRREVLTALGITGGGLQGEFERALDGIELNNDVLQSLDQALHGFKESGRMFPPAQIIDGMTGNVAILDGLRRGATAADQDRRAMLVRRFSSGGLRAVAQARPVIEMNQASPRVKGLAANEMALAYAQAGNPDESYRFLDTATDWLAQPVRQDDTLLEQRSVAVDDLYYVHRTTCDVYLGFGDRVIPVLESRLDSLVTSSFRTATITRAKLARAYANAGQPEDACRVAWHTLDAIERVGSVSARTELRRAIPVLNQWHGRGDVHDVMHRLGV